MRWLIFLLLWGCSSPRSSELAVIGGQASAAPPSFAGLFLKGESEPFCGAVLIEEDVALTAAHCVLSALGELELRLGLEDLDQLPEAHPVLAVHAHERYHSRSIMHDIALLYIAPGKGRRPIALADETPGPYPLKVYGFGSLNAEIAHYPRQLQTAELSYISGARCQSLGGPYSSLLEEQACAGELANGARDSCFGDSGGPLLVEDSDGDRLFGLVSWGLSCGLKGAPGVYTRVASYRRWLQKALSPEGFLRQDWSTKATQLFYYPLEVEDGTRRRRFSAAHQLWRSPESLPSSPPLSRWSAEWRGQLYEIELHKVASSRYRFLLRAEGSVLEAHPSFSEL